MNSPKIEEILSNPNGFCASHFKKHYPEWIEHIRKTFPASKLIESAYQYFYGPAPVCPVCGKSASFLSFFRGYGTYCSSKCQRSSPERTIKAKQTCLERYGDPNYNNTQKNRATKFERYGDEFYLNPEKRRQTCLERYGVENVFASDITKAKIRQTCLERYGVENVACSADIAKRISAGIHNTTLQRHDFLIGYTESGEWICRCPHIECNKCKDKQYIISAQHQLDRMRMDLECCTILNPINSNESSLEIFVTQLLDKWNIKYEKNNRSILDGFELDIYIPALKIAIECNGCYWHSTVHKSKTYHKRKYIECASKGIQLIQLWEDWILNNPQIVESLLKSKLGLCNDVIQARKCYVKQITSKIATKFLIKNHIQGRCNAKVHLGLYHDLELVAVMSFARRSKLSGSKTLNDGEWELVRFCNICNYRVIGGAGKLLKYFMRNFDPHTITSFSSNDISDGNLYKALGFHTDGRVKTSYYYVKDNHRYHRSSFTKSNIVKRGWRKHIDNSWTEREVMSEQHYQCIYDSGVTCWKLSCK